MFLRSFDNYDVNEASDQAGLCCADETKAQQHFKDQCDINRIVKDYVKTGLVPGTTRMPFEEDFVGVTDYHTSMNLVLQANQAFMEFSPQLRERFNNDPGAMLDFINDEQNRAEAESLGLVTPRLTAHVPVDAPVGEAQAQ